MQTPQELEEIRDGLEQIRTLLESLVVRGLRACGPDELSQIGGFAEQLAQSGAGQLSSRLFELRSQIERDERTSAQTLLATQTNVRLLERLLTLRVVKWQYVAAIEAVEYGEVAAEGDNDFDDEVESDKE